jgi:mRNA-degrading endonuclease toxin of MazEF toxin-antitoxin module
VARLGKLRPVLVLTRELVRPHLNTVTVAPITTTIRGLSTEVIMIDHQETQLPRAIDAAFDLD